MTHLDLFSGIGGFSIAAEWAGFQTTAFAEMEPDASLVLRHWWPDVPNLGDVRAITENYHESPTLLTAGVPCQPASLVGKRRGTSDDRWLWPDTIRIVSHLRPRFAVFENPPAILTLESGGAINRIAAELSALGYDLWWDVIPACSVGAGHIRERLLIVASDSLRSRRGAGMPRRLDCDPARKTEQAHQGSEAADSDRTRLEGHAGNGASDGGRPGRPRRATNPESLRGVVSCSNWWHEDVTGIPVLVPGIPNRLAEAYHRCIGNSVVPQAIYPILKAIADHV